VPMLTPKQEKFALAVAAGVNQSDGYRQAYDAKHMQPGTVRNKAHLLMKKDSIRARVDALRAPVLAMVEYSLRDAMDESQEAFQVAKNTNSGSAMVAAVSLRAKLHGLLVERREIALTEVQRLSDDDLDRLIALKGLEAGVASPRQRH
jgi:hypothetical protein